MIPILTKDSAYELDHSTIDLGISTEEELMNSAGFSIACYVIEKIPDPFNKKILIVSGKGNNGGDGLIIHHYLSIWGCDSNLVLIDKEIKINNIFKNYNLSNTTFSIYNPNMDFSEFDLIIEGILGIGISRKLDNRIVDIIKKINKSKNILSIDIPSGIFCDSGNMKEIAISARQTHTLGYPKLGHFINEGLNRVGKLHIHDIGFSNLKSYTFSLIEEKDIFSNIIKPNIEANKYSKGKLVIIGGSKKYSGALELASISGYRAGAGFVKALVPEDINSYINKKVPELIVDSISKKNIINAVDWADSIVIGPGLIIEKNEFSFILKTIKGKNKPIVIDASAFDFINTDFEINDFPYRTIFTPHKGELKKLAYGINISLEKEPIQFFNRLIDKLESKSCLIKGQPNFLINADRSINLMNYGDPLLATAGTGDVLSGIIGSLLAQNYNEKNAMIIGSWVHAETAKIYAKKNGGYGMIASDLLDLIPKTFEKYFVN